MKRAVHAGLALVILTLVTSSCTSILGSFDYTGTGGTTTSTTSSSSGTTMASSSSSGTGGMGGTGGTGGGGTCTETCTAASSCPAPQGECAYAICDGKGCCGVAKSSPNTPCHTGGTICDGSGNCVQCLNTGSCPVPSSPTCATPTCKMGMCGDDYAASGTKCTEGGGAQCDGKGACVTCLTTNDCPATGTACATAVCTAGACKTTYAVAETACTDNGKFCDGSGKCVACIVAGDCPASTTVCASPTCDATAHTCGSTSAAKGTACEGTNNVCDGNGNCTSTHCSDGTKDGGETGVDCGGTCPSACPNLQGCAMAKDCLSGYCNASMVCAVCTTDAQCGTGNYCDLTTSGGTCKPTKGPASACTLGDQCTSTFCVNNVCCDKVCTGNCLGCIQSLTNVADGTCANLVVGTAAPSGQCLTGATCGNDGKCGAGGTCEQLLPSNTCGTVSCINGMATPIGHCNGSGACNAGTAAPCAGNLQCAPGGTMCLNGCGAAGAVGDANCISGYYCDGQGAGVCQPKKGPGTACAAADQCTSGACANGVCCSGACTGTCMGCTMALTGMADGTCAPYKPQTAAPAGQCPTSPTLPCGNDGKCAAGGTCEQALTTTQCAAPMCSGNMVILTEYCDGIGNCKGNAPAACGGNLVCASGGMMCLTACGAAGPTGDANCVSGYYCDGVSGGSCKPKGGLGATCTAADQCSGGFCVDGYCCNNACAGTCSACNLSGSPGTCGTEPPGSNNPNHPCAGGAGNVCCAAGCANTTNDVNNCGSCAKVCPASTTKCQTPTCTNGACTVANAAQGTACTDSGGKVCNAGGACVQCNTSADCSGGYQCSAGACVQCLTNANCSAASPLCCGGTCNATWVQVSTVAGGYHTCGVKTDGTVWCWGYNNAGQIGDGTTTDRPTPVQVTALGTSVAQVSAGGAHTCARKTDGTLWCWGYNVYGQVGNGTTTQAPLPVQVGVSTLGSLVAQVSGGLYHTCARRTDGTLWCWGLNNNGQLGNGTTTNASVPGQVSTLGTSVAQVSAGAYHACVRKTDASAWCWGLNSNGQLGDTTLVQRPSPVAVVGLGSLVADIAAGGAHSCAVQTTGALWCWGLNNTGQIGDGTTTQRPTAVQVGTSKAGVTTGTQHTCARATAGTLSCWGENVWGDVGDDTLVNRTTPVTLASLGSTITQASAGNGSSCAVRTDGTLWCWGYDVSFQVGDGSGLMARPLPARLPIGVCDQCDDGKKDGSETDVDCGGSCVADGLVCADGKACSVNSDCDAPVSFCKAGICTSTCADGAKDNLETSVDCGGPYCGGGCADGAACSVSSDCASTNCSGGICKCLPSGSDCSVSSDCCSPWQCDSLDIVCE